MILKLFFSTALILSSININYAQSICNEIIGNAGSFDSNSNYSVAWTIGEVVTQTVSDSTNTVTQGFHQSGQGWNPITVSEISGVNSNIRIYPNPASYEVTIDFGKTNTHNHKLKLFDIDGKTVLNEFITTSNANHIINMNQLSTGIYLLKITPVGDENAIQTFRINKIN